MKIQAEGPTAAKCRLIPSPIPDPAMTLFLRTCTNLHKPDPQPKSVLTQLIPRDPSSWKYNSWAHRGSIQHDLPSLCLRSAAATSPNPPSPSSSTPPQELLSFPTLEQARFLSSCPMTPLAGSPGVSSSSKKHQNSVSALAPSPPSSKYGNKTKSRTRRKPCE